MDRHLLRAQRARTTRDEVAATSVNCGVRVVEGQHRAYVTDFIRDARAGGCAAGMPPSNLGFRLVRDDDPSRRLKTIKEAGRSLVHALGLSE